MSRRKSHEISEMHGALLTVIDDDESIRTSTERMLRSHGFKNVAVFPRAESFLQSYRLLATDCLILDEQMPGMSGLELQAHLTAAGYRMPIIFITGSHDASKRDRALQGGAVAYLPKPFTAEALLAAIRVALDGTRESTVVTAGEQSRAENDLQPESAVATHTSPHGPVSKALSELREYAAREEDGRNLSRLVIEINILLDIVQSRLGELEDARRRETD
jgi:FixJ family two-component response regulator